MADEIQKDRSPRCPRIPLEEAIKIAKGLHEKIGKSSVKAETTWRALDFTSDNGAVTKILASLNQYGLIERSKGHVSITPLAIEIFHPLGDKQKLFSLQKAALKSEIFVRIRKQFHDCDESVLANQLVQLGFTPNGASRTAQIYKANVKYARLDLIDPNTLKIHEDTEETKSPPTVQKKAKAADKGSKDINKAAPLFSPSSPALDPFSKFFLEQKKMLPVPLGSGGTVQIPYPMSAEDFTLLMQTLKLWKKRIVQEPEEASEAEK
jgi:hypothetical protein